MPTWPVPKEWRSHRCNRREAEVISDNDIDSVYISGIAFPCLTQSFAADFAKLARPKQLTQAAVAAALKISQSAVAQWESGRSFPSTGLATQDRKAARCGSWRGGRRAQHARRAPHKQARLPIVGLPAPGDDERIIMDGSTRGEIAAPPQLENVPGGDSGLRARPVHGTALLSG